MKATKRHGNPKVGPSWSPRSAERDLSRAETNRSVDSSLDFTLGSLQREVRLSGSVLGDRLA
jgi:hypothetical protein